MSSIDSETCRALAIAIVSKLHFTWACLSRVRAEIRLWSPKMEPFFEGIDISEIVSIGLTFGVLKVLEKFLDQVKALKMVDCTITSFLPTCTSFFPLPGPSFGLMQVTMYCSVQEISKGIQLSKTTQQKGDIQKKGGGKKLVNMKRGVKNFWKKSSLFVFELHYRSFQTWKLKKNEIVVKFKCVSNAIFHACLCITSCRHGSDWRKGFM